MIKVLFPVGVPGAVETSVEGLKACAYTARFFIDSGNIRSLIFLFESMTIPLIHYPEAARQIAVKALAFSRMSSIGEEIADYLAAEEMLRSKRFLEVCEFAAQGRPGAARQLVDFTDIDQDAFTELVRHALEGNENAIWFLSGVHLTSTWRKIPNILETLSRFHGVTFDLWLRSALKGVDAKLMRAVLREEDIRSLLSASRRSETTLRQAAEIKDRAEPGWDEKIVRNGARILRVLFGIDLTHGVVP